MTMPSRIKALGTEFSMQQMPDSIAPFAPVPVEASVERDIAYGTDERHRLAAIRSVLLYICAP